jgi:hypothetical protein
MQNLANPPSADAAAFANLAEGQALNRSQTEYLAVALLGDAVPWDGAVFGFCLSHCAHHDP